MDDLSERLFAHYVGGRWRVPLSTQQMPVTGQDGRQIGQIVIAGARDFARAQAMMRGADGQARDRLALALKNICPVMAEAVALARPAEIPVLLAAEPDDPAAFGAVLGASLGAGGLWCPRPEVAPLATLIAVAVDAAEVPPGAFALLNAFTVQTSPLLRATGLATLGAARGGTPLGAAYMQL
ncbi:MAG: hypothetical protein EA339_14025 [Rhodobacteraceae bacterium]|nr:MAG: hypothetical protein EA339_14025 [Paracoccaceae bacterium]